MQRRAGRSILMRSWMSLQAGFGDFQYRRNVYLFALRMSFVAVILSGVILTLTIPPLGFFGLLPMTLSHAIGFGAVFSWLVGGTVCGMLSLAAGFTMHELTLSRAEFEKLSRTDTLSGLLNRRAFAEALDKAEDNASLVIFDVDRFKAINDRFGHACGDAVITAVSAMLRSAFDEMSVVARLGGEEFGVIVSGELEARLKRIEGVRARIASGAIAAEGHDIRFRRRCRSRCRAQQAGGVCLGGSGALSRQGARAQSRRARKGRPASCLARARR
ncbi:GGDEF domain-containing protein [Rhizobium phaseoli]|nr:GGDEF domain-containing protein [Rhizobium phaseoli]